MLFNVKCITLSKFNSHLSQSYPDSIENVPMCGLLGKYATD